MSSTKSTDPKAPATKRGSVILCAHGSAVGGGAAERHAERLRETGRFERVVTCCLHGMPNLAMAFTLARTPAVTVVPMLMADGYTSRTVLPAAVADVAPDGVALRITPPLGTSPGVGDIIARRALLACLEKGWQPAQAGLLVAGHGTPRDPRSGETVEAAAARLREGGAFGEVRTGFLEQPPLLADVLSDLQSAPCVVAGYFADAGGHAVQDLPALIEANHPDAVYLGPVGADPEIADVIVALLQGDLPSS
jgi:sirohydrochlorin ferrochelatase